MLLISKLTPPVASRYAVDRTSIWQQVFMSFEAKVILVRAPAGFGKTTVMTQLLERFRQEGTGVAWVSLDESDNDLPRFLSYMMVALRNQLGNDSDLPRPDAAGLQKYADMWHLAQRIEHRLGESGSPFVLFIDELEVIRDPAVLGFIRQTIVRLPANGKLVLGSRCMPDIGLGRLRARGQLVEVAPEQLRFSANEASHFLTQRRGLSLKPEQVQSLLSSTEGWPTALWLASVALERRSDAEEFIAGFAGSDAGVAEYLADDVLAGQSEAIRNFLLKTSILSQFDASLCDAVCGRTDSAEILEYLQRNNLFLTLIDESARLYRYHSLFRDFLRSQLTRHLRSQLPALHRAAADWFLAQNRPVPAIDHALEAGDLGFALPLLNRHTESLLNQGRLRLLTRWLESLPAATLENSPRLRLIHIWAVNLTRGPQEALALLRQIDPASLDESTVLAQFHAMQPTFLGMRDQIDESHALGLERLKLVLPEHGFPYAILSQTLANDSMILGQYADARRYADQAQAAQTGSEASLQMSLAGAVNGSIDLIQGRLRQALAELRIAAGITENNPLQTGNRNLLPGVLYAEALYEAGRIEQAETLLNLFVPSAQNLGLADQLIIAHSVLARISERQNDADRALELLSLLESLGHRLGLFRVIASARIERASLLLARGDIVGSREQLQQAGDADYWRGISSRSFIANDKITLVIGQMRCMVRGGEAAQALPLLKQQIEEAEAAQRNRRALKLRILLAEALKMDGQHKLAMRTLSRALELGAREGFIGSFVEEGPRVEEMLREVLRARQIDSGHGEDDPISLHLRSMAGRISTDARDVAPASNPSEALTRKELQILELLAQGQSNEAMAKNLFISESTVRTHLRSINTKLQASNRMHALAIARRMHLIG